MPRLFHDTYSRRHVHLVNSFHLVLYTIFLGWPAIFMIAGFVCNPRSLFSELTGLKLLAVFIATSYCVLATAGYCHLFRKYREGLRWIDTVGRSRRLRNKDHKKSEKHQEPWNPAAQFPFEKWPY